MKRLTLTLAAFCVLSAYALHLDAAPRKPTPPPVIALGTVIRGPFLVPKLATQGKLVKGKLRLTLGIDDTPINRAAVAKLTDGAQINGELR